MTRELDKTTNFDPQKSLWELNIFQLAVILAVATAAVIALWICIFTELEFEPSADGVNQLVTIFKVPLGILALLIPVIALIASIHRSVQTAAQIRIATDHNNFNNYYTHIREFANYVEKLHVREVLGLHRNPRALHEALFPNARDGNFTLDESRIDPTPEKIYQLYLCFEGMDDTTPLDVGMISRILKISEIERSMFGQFALDNDPIGEQIDWDDPRELYFPDSMNDLYEGIERKVSTFFDIVSFDTKYQYDKRILTFLRLKPYIPTFRRQDLTKAIQSMSNKR